MQKDLTQGPITSNLLRFAVPLMIGNLLQQFYNIADTWIVGQFLGADALAAVGSSYTLMVFLTSILLGLCMGSGAVFSIYYGRKDEEKLKSSIFQSFALIGAVTLVLTVLVFAGLAMIIRLLQVPVSVVPLMHNYLWVIFWGIPATFFYNYFANMLRAVGNSVTPIGFAVCPRIWYGCRRGSGSHRFGTVSFRFGHYGIYAAVCSVAAHTEKAYGMENGYFKRNYRPFLFNMRPTVYYEFRHIDGAGLSEQFWRRDYGCFCGSGENRFFCLYASAGFRQCIFYLCGTKLWSRKE